MLTTQHRDKHDNSNPMLSSTTIEQLTLARAVHQNQHNKRHLFLVLVFCSISLSLYLSLSLSLSSSLVCAISIYIYFFYFSLYIYIFLSLFLFISLSISLSFFLSFSLSLYFFCSLSLSLYLFMCLPLPLLTTFFHFGPFGLIVLRQPLAHSLLMDDHVVQQRENDKGARRHQLDDSNAKDAISMNNSSTTANE